MAVSVANTSQSRVGASFAASAFRPASAASTAGELTARRNTLIAERSRRTATRIWCTGSGPSRPLAAAGAKCTTTSLRWPTTCANASATDRPGGRSGAPSCRGSGALPEATANASAAKAGARHSEANLARERDRKWLHCRWGALQPDPAEAVLGGDRANCAVQQGQVYRAVFRRKAEASRPAFECSHRNQRLRQDMAERGCCPTCRDHRCGGAEWPSYGRSEPAAPTATADVARQVPVLVVPARDRGCRAR